MRAIEESEFDAELALANGLVLVDFWAEWCGPCGVVGPILEGIEPDYAGRVDFWKVNADENRSLMNAFGIRSLPSVVLLQPTEGGGAQVLGHVIGAQGAPTFIRLLEDGLNPTPGFFTRLVKALTGGRNGK